MTPKNLLFLVIILVAWITQSFLIHRQTSTNDICQNQIAARFFFSQDSIYHLFPVTNCWQGYTRLSEQSSAYPPATILFFLPTAFLSSHTLTLSWDILSPFLYILIIINFLFLVGYLRFWLVATLFTLSTLWVGLLNSYAARNLNLLLLTLIFLAFSVYRHRPSWAGFLIGIAALLKIWPLLFLIPQMFSSLHRRITYSGLITFALGISISLLIFSPFSYRSYISRVIPFEKNFFRSTSNSSLTSMLYKTRLGVQDPDYPAPPEYINQVLVFYIIFLLLLQITTLRHISAISPYFSLIIPLFLVFFPLSWDNGLLFLLFPLAILIRNLRRFSPYLSQKDFFLLAAGFLPMWLPYTHEILTKVFLQLPLTPAFSGILYILLIIFSSLPLLINFVLTDKFSRA